MKNRERHIMLSLKDTLVTAGILLGAALVCALLRQTVDGDVYVSMIFMLAVAIIARLTDGYFYGIAASFVSVLGINYAFTAPYFEFCLSISGYPLTFFSMLVVSVTTSAMTSQIKASEKQHYKAQVEQMRSNLLRAVSHDLRTPLTSISGAGSLLIQNPDMPVEQRTALLREMVDDSDWLVRMVENLLSITRINAEQASIIKTDEAAEEVISEAVRKFRKRFVGLPVEIVLPDEVLIVPMDAILIQQVLTNLLENVMLHAKNATRAWVRLSICEGNAVFTVEDDGAGIPRHLLPGIFEASITRDQSTVDGKRNMGIGLSVCRAIILAHGGAIEAANRPEGGAIFRFQLPMKEGYHEPDSHDTDR